MSDKKKILLQLDTDQHASSFDAITAVDSGVDVLLQHSGIQVDDVESLIHGAMFTRGPQDLRSTAVFVGGSDVNASQVVFDKARKVFFGPVRVSLMLDAAGANTTAAAAMLAVESQFELSEQTITVLGATGSVGNRICRLLAKAHAKVNVVSRSHERAQTSCDHLLSQVPDGVFHPVDAGDSSALASIFEESHGLFSAGAGGVQLVSEQQFEQARFDFAVDLNAVPPTGVEVIQPLDNGQTRHETTCFGAIGVGGLKMKIHKQCIRHLFTTNDAVLDLHEIYSIGKEIVNA